jgi:hypothetical protein
MKPLQAVMPKGVTPNRGFIRGKLRNPTMEAVVR